MAKRIQLQSSVLFVLLQVMMLAITFTNGSVLRVPIQKKEPKVETQSSSVLTIQGTALGLKSESLSNHDQLMYFGNILIGKNNQQFSIDFDTGSNVLWIPSSNCSNCSSNFSKGYNCITQDECTISQNTDHIQYGKGEVLGTIVSSLVSVAGASPIVQSFLLVTDTDDLSSLSSDGLFGLGVYTEPKYGNSPSYVQLLYNQGYIEAPIFSMYLSFNNDSMLDFGGYDNSKIAKDQQLNYHKIMITGKKDQTQRWLIPGSQISMGNTNISFSKGALIDSGTSLITLPTTMFNQIASMLSSNYGVLNMFGALIVGCSASLPDFEIMLYKEDGSVVTYTIPSRFYVYKLSSGQCQLLFQTLDIPDVSIILGDVFMRRYISVFNPQDLTIGLAQSINDPGQRLALWIILLIAFGSFIVIVIGIYCFVKYRKNKKQKQRQLQRPFLAGTGVAIGSSSTSSLPVQAGQYQVQTQRQQVGIVHSQSPNLAYYNLNGTTTAPNSTNKMN